MTKPLFTGEGPQYYDAAYKHNRPFAKPGPYQTALTTAEEGAFRQWVAKNRVPFDPNAKIVDYDMRGYWRSSGGKLPAHGERGMPYAWPDTFKTPYDTTFSKESKYATADCPFVWQEDDNLVDQRNGQLIFGTAPTTPGANESGYSSRAGRGAQSPGSYMAIRHVDGSISPRPLLNAQVRLRQGEGLVLVTPNGIVDNGQRAGRYGATVTISS
jgi:hypothetical protein